MQVLNELLNNADEYAKLGRLSQWWGPVENFACRMHIEADLVSQVSPCQHPLVNGVLRETSREIWPTPIVEILGLASKCECRCKRVWTPRPEPLMHVNPRLCSF